VALTALSLCSIANKEPLSPWEGQAEVLGMIGDSFPPLFPRCKMRSLAFVVTSLSPSRMTFIQPMMLASVGEGSKGFFFLFIRIVYRVVLFFFLPAGVFPQTSSVI